MSKIGIYDVLGSLGKGGMGEVYKVKNSYTNELGTLKTLSRNLLSNPIVQNRFNAEVNTLISLKHKYIQSITDYFKVDQQPYMVSEYFEGYDLSQYMLSVTGIIEEQRAYNIIKKVLNALIFANARNIVHKDVKPKNILISKDGNDVKLIDFGIAENLSQKENLILDDSIAMGSMLYMSPEQISNEGVDSRSDIYSLGITWFEMLTGKHPFYSNGDSMAILGNKILDHKRLTPTSFYPVISAKIETVIMKMIEIDKKDRYQSLKELYHDVFGLRQFSFGKDNKCNYVLRGWGFREHEAILTFNGLYDITIDSVHEKSKIEHNGVIVSQAKIQNDDKIKIGKYVINWETLK